MSYPSSLTDQQWSLIEGYFFHGKYGNMSKYSKRKLVDAILYVTTTGCQWRQLPKEFPPWQTAYSFFRRAKNRGIWGQVLRDLVEKSRIRMGKHPLPTDSIIDSQSIKTTSASKERGIDGGKKGKGP
jgi:putative transposase